MLSGPEGPRGLDARRIATSAWVGGACADRRRGLGRICGGAGLGAEARNRTRGYVGRDAGSAAAIGGVPARDLFVLPSLFDSFPIAILEAMAAGLPVIATRVGGVPEVVLDGETGLLVEPGDPKRLASAIEMLASDASARRNMGKQGRARAQLFSWEDVIARTWRVYQEAVNGRAA